MKNEIGDINEVIIRFLDGTATCEEKVFLLNWLKQSEKNRNEFSEVRDLWLLGNTLATDDVETEVALDRFRSRIQIPESGSRKSRFVFPEHFSLFLRVAAVFLILFAVGSVSYYWGSSSAPGQKEVMNRLLTANGSKGRFVLPDSTVVWLNSNSLLEYPETFSASVREVSLSGFPLIIVDNKACTQHFHFHFSGLHPEWKLLISPHFKIGFTGQTDFTD